MKPYLRRTLDQWQQLVSQQQTSGLSIAQFCQHHDIASASFYAWRKRLSHSMTNPAEAEPVFVELNIEPEQLNSPLWAVELELGGGMFLRIAKP